MSFWSIAARELARWWAVELFYSKAVVESRDSKVVIYTKQRDEICGKAMEGDAFRVIRMEKEFPLCQTPYCSIDCTGCNLGFLAPPVFGNIFAEAVPLFLYSTSWAIGQQSRPLSESLVCTALHSVSLFGMERSGAAYPAMAAKSVDWIIQFFPKERTCP